MVYYLMLTKEELFEVELPTFAPILVVSAFRVCFFYCGRLCVNPDSYWSEAGSKISSFQALTLASIPYLCDPKSVSADSFFA